MTVASATRRPSASQSRALERTSRSRAPFGQIWSTWAT
jgi:hypothetical protein